MAKFFLLFCIYEQFFHAGKVVCLGIHRVGYHHIYMIILSQPFIIDICLGRGMVGVCFSPQEDYLRLMSVEKAFGGGREGGRALCSVYLVHRRYCLKSALFGTMLCDRGDELKTTPPLPCCLVPERLAW